jgi:hypothetical protein
MNIFKLFSYKLENFLNIRPYPKELGAVFFTKKTSLHCSLSPPENTTVRPSM